MSRTLPWILSTLILAACTPATSTSPRRGLTGPTGRPVRPGITVLPRVLPIPEDYGVIRLNLARFWTTTLYRKYRPRITSYLSDKVKKISGSGALANRCGFRLERDLQTFSFATDPRNQNTTKIVVVRVRTDANRLLRCLVQHPGPDSTYKSFHFGPLRGKARYKQGILQDEVLVLDNHRLVWFEPAARLAVREVLTGNRRSVTATPLYQTVRGNQNVAPTFLVVLPSLHDIQKNKNLSFLGDMMAAGLAVNLPQGGLNLRGLLAFEKKGSAAMLLRMLPLLSNALSKKSPALAPLVKLLRLTLDPADPAVVRMGLDLTAAQVAPLIALADKMLSGLSQKSPPARP